MELARCRPFVGHFTACSEIQAHPNLLTGTMGCAQHSP